MEYTRPDKDGSTREVSIHDYYKLLVDNMDEGAVSIAADGTVLFCNSKFAQFLHCTQDQIIGHSFSDFIAADCKYRLAQFLEKAQLDHCRGQLRLEMLNGSQLPVQVSIRKLANSQQGAFCIFVTDLSVLDSAISSLQEQVQQRMVIEAQLLETQKHLEGRVEERTAELARANSQLQREIGQHLKLQAKFRKLVEHSTIGIMIADLRGQISYANSAMLAMIGYDETDLKNGLVRWDTLTPPEFAHADAESVEQLRSTGVSNIFEKVYISKDGTRVPVLISGTVLEYDHEHEPLVAAFITDMRPLKQAQHALAESRSRYQLAIEASKLGTWEFYPVTGQMFWSERAKRIFEVREDEEITYEEFLAFVHPDDRDRIIEISESSVASGRNMEYVCDFSIITEQKALKHLELCGQVIFENTKDQSLSVRLIGTIKDVTEFKQAQAKLQLLNETLEQQVKARTEISQYRAAQLRKLAAQLTQVEQRERKRLATILHDHIQQLLAAAKLKTGMLKVRLTDKSMKDSISQINDLLSQSIAASRTLSVELCPPCIYEAGLVTSLNWLANWMREKHNLEVSVQAESKLRNISEDIRVLIFQITRELLFNIVKHAGVNRATVSLRTAMNEIVVIVSDEGKGFDCNAAGHKNSTGGFGLFSVRERIEYLGGCFDVRSAEGKGTKICFIIPITVAENTQVNIANNEDISDGVLHTGWLWKDVAAENQPQPPRILIKSIHAQQHVSTADPAQKEVD